MEFFFLNLNLNLFLITISKDGIFFSSIKAKHILKLNFFKNFFKTSDPIFFPLYCDSIAQDKKGFS